MNPNKNRKSNKVQLFVIQASLFVLGTCLTLKHILFKLNSISLGDEGDTRLNFFFLKWASDFVLGRVPHRMSIFDFPIFYPSTGAIGFSDNLLGNLPLFLPGYLITNNMFIAGNIWLIICLLLRFSTFNYFLRYFRFFNNCSSNFLKELFIGLLSLSYTYALPVSALSGHPQTWPGFLFPLIVILMHLSWTTLRLTHFALLALTTAYQFWLGIQLGLMAVYWLLLAFAIGFYVCLRTQRQRLLKFMLGGTIFCVIYGISVSPLLPPYLKAKEIVGYRSFLETHAYAPKFPTGLINLSSNHSYSHWLHFLHAGEEDGVFISMVWFIAVFLTLFRWKWFSSHPLWKGAWLSWLAVVLFMSRGSPLYHLFHSFVPGFGSIRTPGRFVLMAIPFAYVLIAIVIQQLYVHRRKKWLYAFSALLLLDLWGWNPRHFAFSTQDSKLGKELMGHPTLFLPHTNDPYKQMDQFAIASVSWAPILDGYTGWDASVFKNIWHMPVEEQKKILTQAIQKLGIQNIVVDNAANDWISYLSQTFPGRSTAIYDDRMLIKISVTPDENLIRDLQLHPRPFSTTGM